MFFKSKNSALDFDSRFCYLLLLLKQRIEIEINLVYIFIHLEAYLRKGQGLFHLIQSVFQN